MADTTHLQLPLIAAAQAQKHVTHNDALLRLDALVQLSVASRGLSAPPAAPSDGERHIPAIGATGAWTGWDLNVAWFADGVWTKLVPREGWIGFVEDEQRLLVYRQGSWTQFACPRFTTSQMIFTPGGSGENSIYRIDASSGQNPRTATIGSVAGDIITLTANVAATIFLNHQMAGVVYARIWNMSKTPVESAWVIAQPAANQLQVLSSAAISAWAAGETIQMGDPTDITQNRCFALDISPMLQNLLGGVFRQSGLMVKSSIISGTVGDSVDVTPTGVSGSFTTAAKTYAANVLNGDGVTIIPCTELSPVSNSNLVFVRETIATTGTTRLLSSMAVFG